MAKQKGPTPRHEIIDGFHLEISVQGGSKIVRGYCRICSHSEKHANLVNDSQQTEYIVLTKLKQHLQHAHPNGEN